MFDTMMKNVPITGEFKKALPVLETIQAAGFEAYYVGGSVRDALLGKAVNDVDIATSAFPEEIKQLFTKTVDVGIEHGTVMVLLEGESYEVTTFRTESTYQDFRRPDSVTFVRSLKEDLKRRDLTINAFAMDQTGEIQDFFGGEQDLDNQVIRAVGKAEERFNEDALRMMRAVRFASQLGFFLEADTFYAIVANAPLLENIAVERIRVEFVKMAMGKHVRQGFAGFVETRLYMYCPGLLHAKEALRNFVKVKEPIKSERQVWALLLYQLGIQEEKEARAFLRHWKLSNKLVNESADLHQLLLYRMHYSQSNETVYRYTKELALDAETCLYLLDLPCDKEAVEEIDAHLPIHSRKELDVDGKIIMETTRQRGGKWLGQALIAAERAVLKTEIPNDTKEILAYLKQNDYI
ncbi:tRNA nucleotidyltransferase (CCA-adding enzyme) [Alkalibacterium subtropicum]|uniref:CCA-adding enzyme n=2 Tax=Alkalibacterium subtropicum TaxID=753702 RepID=A0A1I1J566_9LACT|nr:tRNA nucleotidyltransferase (CCA-adding enzyme) [Alkalibacterium subtropicum]